MTIGAIMSIALYISNDVCAACMLFAFVLLCSRIVRKFEYVVEMQPEVLSHDFEAYA